MRHPTGLLGLLLVVTFAATVPCRAGEGAAAGDRCNFVMIIADDMSWDDCGAYGNPAARTPHLDRLAREGMRFDRAFLTASSCSPSRASLLTGRYPHSTGAPELHMPVPANQVLLTSPMREAGYFTAVAGKWHLGPHVRKQLDLVLDKPPGPSGCEQWLELLRTRPKDKPFFLWLAAIDPHRPYAQGAEARHDPAQVVVPPDLPDTPGVRKDLADYFDEIARLDDAVGAVLDELDAQGVSKHTAVLFLSDNGRPFPRAKTTLYDAGIRTPLIVRLPGRTAPGSASQSLVSAVDVAPTVLELAGVRAPDTLQGKSFARMLSDPSATVRDFAYAEHNWHDYRAHERGVRSPRYTYIRNYIPELTGSPPADAVVGPTFQLMRQLHAAGKLAGPQADPFVAPRPPEELYDSEADPHALNNLAADPRHADALAQLRQALEAWQSDTGDRFDPALISPDRFDRGTGKRLPPQR